MYKYELKTHSAYDESKRNVIVLLSHFIFLSTQIENNSELYRNNVIFEKLKYNSIQLYTICLTEYI